MSPSSSELVNRQWTMERALAATSSFISILTYVMKTPLQSFRWGMDCLLEDVAIDDDACSIPL
jgi:hypothetical protein